MEISRENLFSNALWSANDGPAIKEVNKFLVEKAANLIACDPSTSIFSDRLKLSKNFQLFNDNEADVIPFQSGSKPVSLCALMINKMNPSELTLCMLHPLEADFLRRMMEQERKFYLKEPTDGNLVKKPDVVFDKFSRDFDLILINPGSGVEKIAELSPDSLDQDQEKIGFIKKLQHTPEYVELMAQAKFFNGNITNYTSEELAYLKNWILKEGPEKMENLLLRNILKSRPEARRRFEKSPLQNIFF